jgi:hypothetical protein
METIGLTGLSASQATVAREVDPVHDLFDQCQKQPIGSFAM